jgi:hypothetical protein
MKVTNTSVRIAGFQTKIQSPYHWNTKEYVNLSTGSNFHNQGTKINMKVNDCYRKVEIRKGGHRNRTPYTHVEFFRVLTLCSVVVGYQIFIGPCCLNFQGAYHNTKQRHNLENSNFYRLVNFKYRKSRQS